jgi:hypothetical protein
LDTPFAKLPSLDAETFAVLFAELDSILAPHAGYLAPPEPEAEHVSAGPHMTPYIYTRSDMVAPEAAPPAEEKRTRWWSSFENMWREGT